MKTFFVTRKVSDGWAVDGVRAGGKQAAARSIRNDHTKLSGQHGDLHVFTIKETPAGVPEFELVYSLPKE